MQGQPDDIKKLGKLIEKIKVAMLTTVSMDGSLHSRPMYTQQHEFDGTLWFFAGQHSIKSEELAEDARVNVSYAAPDDQCYVSVSGTAAVVKDRAKFEELWSPLYKAWFPGGLEDPELALLRIDVERAEYWDSPSSAVVQLTGFLKAIATGKRAKGGENKKIEINA